MEHRNSFSGQLSFADYGTINGSGSIILYEKLPKGHKASSRATVFHIINLYVGLGLLAQAYALQQGGWVALLLMGLCCLFASYTGKVVVRCFQRLQEQGFSDDDASWAALAQYVWGPRAKWVVFGLAVVELFGAGCMAMLMLWRNLQGIFPHTDMLHIELGSILCIVPSLFANGFGELVFVSILGVASKALTTLLPVVVYFTLTKEATLRHSKHDIVNLPTLPMSFAVIMLSYSAHVALPSIYMSMAAPSDFEQVISTAFLLMLLLYATMGTFGYLVFGTECSPLITYDVTSSASQSWQFLFTEVVSFLVTWSIYATIVPIISVVAETMSGITCCRDASSGLTLKLCLLLCTAGICHILHGQLGYVEVLLGVMSTIVSLFIPMAMHLKLFGPAMGFWAKLRTLCLLFCSGCCVLLVAVSGIQDALRGHHSDPSSS